MVVFLTSSRTRTTPCATLVMVLVQVSWTSHLVPRTVAALYWPRVRNSPLPSPQSLRVLALAAAALAFPSGSPSSFSDRVSVVTPPDWLSLKMPSLNSALPPVGSG